MKIAIFHELPKTTGSRKAIMEIAKYLKRNHTVDLYYTDKTESNEKSCFNFVYFYKFIPRVWKGNNWKTRLYRDTVELIKLYNLHKRIAGDIDRKKYDIVFVHASALTESPFILRFLKTKTVYYAHASNYTYVFEQVKGIPNVDKVRYFYESCNRYIRKRIDLKNVRSAKVIFANSHFTQNNIEKIYHKKSIISYLGVDTNIYKPIPVKKVFDILYIGSYEPVDGYVFFQETIQSMKYNPKVKVLAYEQEWITDQVKLNELYNKSKIVVCLAYGEPFGLVSIEAQSCGVPVLAVNEGGYKETVINNKTGYLLKRDKNIFAEKLEKLLKNPEILRKLGHNARKTVLDKWDWEKVSRQMVKSLENL